MAGVKAEERLIEDLEKKKHKKQKIELKRRIKHFRFTDFAQAVVGVGVFAMPAILDSSFWEFIDSMSLRLVIYVHLFFLFCAIIALNYQFRDDFSLKDHFFLIMFIKRVFYVYMSVVIVISMILSIIGKAGFSMTIYSVLRYFFAAQTAGLLGAVTFSFFKKVD